MDGLTRRRQAERLMFNGQVVQAMKLAGAHSKRPAAPMPQAPTRPPVVNPKPIDVPPVPKSEIPKTGIAAFFAFILSIIFKRK